MDKEAFKRSLKGTVRHLKRKFKTMDPVKKWTGIGAGVGGGIGAGTQHLTNKAVDKWGTKAQKEEKKKHKVLHHPALMGGLMAGYGAVRFREVGHAVKANRQWVKDFRNSFRNARKSYGGGSSGSRGPGGSRRPSSSSKSTPRPDWLKGVTTKEEGKKKYRAEAMKHHPDRGGDPEKMKDLNNAWEAWESKLSHILPFFRAELERIREASR